MTRFTFIVLFLFSTLKIFAQSPNDCVNAIVVCGNGTFSSNATGFGVQEVAGCGGFEHNSIWIKINVVRTGTLGFNLIPNDPSITVDYDFWVFGPNRVCSNLGSPIRCSTTNPQSAGLTSNVTGMVGTTTTTTAGPGANGNGFVRWLDVVAGQSYYIAIDRPVGDGGFDLVWTGSTMDAGGAFATPPAANSIPELRTCSTTPNVGIFDLNSARAQINPDLTNNTITFHTTLANATDGISPLPNIYANTSNPQTIYARVVNNASGCSSITSFLLRVLPVPDATMTVSSTNVCNGDNVTISFNGTPGAVVEYTVDGGAAQFATLDNTGVFQITTPITTTTVYRLVRVKTLDSDNTTTLCSRNKNIIITVNVSTPASPTITSNSTICFGSTATFDITGLANATINYTIDGGANQTATLNGSGQFQVNLPGLAAGTHTLLITSITEPNAPNCTTTTNVSATVTVQPQLIADITASNSVCSGTSGTVTFTGTPNAVVTYTVDGGSNQTITLNASGTATLTTPVLTVNSTYQLVNVETTTAPLCTLAQNDSVTILVTGLPTASISGTASICSGSTSVISFSGSPGATIIYNVNGGTNQTIILDGLGNATLTTPVLTTYTTYTLVNVTTTCTNTASGNAVITVINLPTALISGNTTICSGTTAIIGFTGTPNANVTYNVNGGANQTILLDGTGNASLTTPILTTNSTYTLVSVASATTPVCTQTITNSATVTVLSLPTASVSANTICSGNTGTVTFSGTPNAIVTYTVNGGSNQTITLDGSGIATLTTPVLTANATYQLVSIVTTTIPNCSQNLTANATVVVTSLPTASISGTTTICSGGNTIISFSGTPNAIVTYTVDGGVNQTIILNTSGVASLTTPNLTANSTYQLVSVNGACPNTASGSAVVSVLGLPTASVSAPTICFGTSGTVTFSGTPNAVVNYTIDGGAIQTITLNASGTASVATPILTTNSVYTLVDVTLTTPSSSCNQSLSTSSTVFVTPIPDAIANPSPQTICSGNTTSINLTSSVPGTTFSWVVTSQSNVTGATAGNGTVISNILTATSTVNGVVVYTVTPIANGCSGTPITVQAIVTALPSVIANNLNPSFCSGGTTNIQLSSNVSGATFSWTVTGGNVVGAVGGSGTSINQTLTVSAGTTTSVEAVYEIVAFANGCNGTPQQVRVYVNPVPDLTIASDPVPLCSGQSTNISFTSSISATVFNWVVVSSSGVTGASSGSGASIQQVLTTTGLSQGSVTYQVTPSLNGCTGIPQTVTILVNPNPELFTNPTHPPICSGVLPTNIFLSSFNAGTVFSWTVNAVGVDGASAGSATGPTYTIIQNLTTLVDNVAGYVDYIITPSSGGCSGAPITVRVIVNPLPLPVLTDGSICVDEFGVPFQSYTLDSGLDNATYDFVWYFNGNPIPNSNNFTYTANAIGTYSVIATNMTTFCVSDIVSATVVSTTPATSFTVTQSDYFSDNATLTITVVGGSGTLLYQLDGGTLQSSNVFTNVSSGTHTITVIDSQGCTYLVQTVLVIDYPLYFTPNGDGINDEWFISGLQDTDIIHIFDRYGKLIKQLRGVEKWNGTFNQEHLPSTDYWFTVDYLDNGIAKQFKAHFAMKR